jgi:hypothetical protein
VVFLLPSGGGGGGGGKSRGKARGATGAAHVSAWRAALDAEVSAGMLVPVQPAQVRPGHVAAQAASRRGDSGPNALQHAGPASAAAAAAAAGAPRCD